MVFGKKSLVLWLFVTNFTRVVISCVAQPRGQTRKTPRRAFYLHQQVPDIDEFSQGASGKPKKPIKYNSPAYIQLRENYNPGIVFEDRNGKFSGDTRKMSKLCLEALDKLAILVKGRWPKVRLRVIAAWDEQSSNKHDTRSLHYEGRAVDITTSDTDRAKLGLLARLAVEAGFDWVRYIHKYRVHASVRADGKGEKKFMGMGCFRSNSTVRLEDGKTTTMDRIRVGDKVESMGKNGKIIYSEVVMFLDNKPKENDVMYFVLKTDNPRTTLYLTKSHLVYVRRRFSSEWQIQFAKLVRKGDIIKVWSGGKLVGAEITEISVAAQRGAIAPLTMEGNIVVDNALASCYALLEDHDFVNSIFWPAKALYTHFPYLLNAKKPQQGVHWYARLLLFLNDYLSVLT